MANVVLPYGSGTYDDNDTAVGTQVLADMNAIVNVVNGNIEAANIKDNAVTNAKIVTMAATKLTSVGSMTTAQGYIPTAILPLIGQTSADVTMTDEASHVQDMSLGQTYMMTATADRTLGTPTNATANQRVIIKFKASGANRTLTLPTATTGDFRYGTDITALTTTTSGKTDYIGCVYNGTDSRWDVIAYVKGY